MMREEIKNIYVYLEYTKIRTSQIGARILEQVTLLYTVPVY